MRLLKSLCVLFLGIPLAGAFAEGSWTVQKEAPQGATIFGAVDPAVVYLGRIDRSGDGASISWENSQISLAFEGPVVAFLAQPTKGQSYLQVALDGQASTVKLERGKRWYTWSGPLEVGRHVVTLTKRNEASSGQFTFFGGALATGKRPVAQQPGPKRLKIEFYGDSIAAGSCDEDPGSDQWSDYSTHNAYLAYPAVAARSLGADLVNISVSGTGISATWNAFLAGDYYDALTLGGEKKWDFGLWVPDLVIVAWGQNDLGATAAKGLPFPKDFAQKYAALVLDLRSRYPKARFAGVLAGMDASQSATAQAGLSEASRLLKQKGVDFPVRFFQTWTPNHPRVSDHAQIAEELVTFVRDGLKL